MAERPIYTVAQFADLWGWNEEFVRQMCRQQIDSRSGKKYQLPAGWTAAKVGRDWNISRIEQEPSVFVLRRVAETCSTYTTDHPATAIEITLIYTPTAGWTANLKQPKTGPLVQLLKAALSDL